MPRLPVRALGALLALVLPLAADSAADLAALTPVALERTAAPPAGLAWTALLCAVAAEANGFSADAADWPGRARQAVWTLGDDALARAVPDPWRERTRALRQATRVLATLGAAWQRLRTAAGGSVAAADRALDAAALVAVAAFALRLALRPARGRRR